LIACPTFISVVRKKTNIGLAASWLIPFTASGR
jgi:hypothetical protein